MAHSLSPDTGLPVLPSGERWVVREQKVFTPYDFYPRLTGRLEIVLERELKVESKHAVPRKWWRRSSTATDVSFKWETVPGTKPMELQGDHSVAALNAANRVMKLRAQWEAREALKGAYPPKSLEAS